MNTYDIEGHARLLPRWIRPIATGEMLTSFREHEQLILGNASDFVRRCAACRRYLSVPEDYGSGGETPRAWHGAALRWVHLHLSAAIHWNYVAVREHFRWLVHYSTKQRAARWPHVDFRRHGLGFALGEQSAPLDTVTCEFGKRPLNPTGGESSRLCPALQDAFCPLI